jgi:hypothetical protein
MKPVGLTLKLGRNKYRREARGELMLIHQCTECHVLSINRIAADDDSEAVIAVFQESLTLGQQTHELCQEYGIKMLKAEDAKVIYTQLFGRQAEMSTMHWG